ncbi:MAG: PTS transporter subunit EIIC, partial [Vulcanimicrobiota bacterium]
QFYFWFVWVGGAGGTLGLAIMLLLAKSRRLRQLGKVAIIPGLFNINEPIIFGLPIVANPMMIIPFALGPIVAGSVAYLAFHLDLATRPYLQAPWTMPAPLGAYFSTGGDWRAFVLSVVSILICSAVYYPFVRVYDKHMLEKELNGELEEKGKEEKKEEQPGTDSTEEPVEDNKKGE